MKRLNLLFVFSAAIILAAFVSSCSKDDPTAPLPLPPPPTTAGSWTGTLTQGSVSGPILLNLSQDIIQIKGSVTLGALTGSVSGKNLYPNVAFTCSVPGYEPFSFAGQLTSPRELTGLINGSGFTNATASLTKN